VVCPAIAERVADRRPTSAVALARGLRRTLAPARIGVLHGQIASEEQQVIVAAFRARELDVLVATTVVEVGVDVPGASMMIVEDADRFGLAQLHQLRGRVGRGQAQAHCWLLTQTDDPEALDRLRVIAEVSDGFRIAEEDLRRRGAGDLHGTRQAGMPALRFADLGAYLGLVEVARQEAAALADGDPALALSTHAHLAQAVRAWSERAQPIGEEAG
jgi:ATP-dependent DNA helicase RecG